MNRLRIDAPSINASFTAFAVLCMCSCAVVKAPKATDPFDNATATVSTTTPRPAVVRPSVAPGAKSVNAQGYEVAARQSDSAAGRARIESSNVVPASETVEVRGQSPAFDITRTAPEPRMPPAPKGVKPARYDAPGLVEDSEASSPLVYPDEYLFDGGDHGYPVHYDEYSRLGLESEDTIAEFNDSSGRRRVTPTNRVAVYAPRFGAIETVSSPGEDAGIGKLAGAVTNVGGNGLRGRTATTAHEQRLGAQRMLTRSRPSSIAIDALTSNVAQLQHSAVDAQTLNVFESRTSISASRFDQVDAAQLAEEIQAAELWTRVEYPTISAKTESAAEVYRQDGTAEVVGRKDNSKPGRLMITKTADKRAAHSGDIVTFTIRYENAGDHPITDVAIVDNLTPRLEYVPESVRSSRNAQFITEDNGEGSLILRWELEGPLEAKTSGVVGFQARVR